MQTFYSQEQYDEYERDLEGGDGFTNEFQRCYHDSRIRRPIKAEHTKAEQLHALGRVVVCASWEVCCPVTDGLIGYDFVVIGDFATREEALQATGLDTREYDGDGRFIFEPEPATPPAPALRDLDDIPF
jgi:hypothetical protein